MIMMLPMISHTTVMPGLYFLIILCNLRVARLLDVFIAYFPQMLMAVIQVSRPEGGWVDRVGEVQV